jgi:ABC-2 type transport system ATP-binding protein
VRSQERGPVELVIANVTKQYGPGNVGLRDCCLTLRPGVCGLLGPNGAGKSTLMRILATITRPTRGHVTWNGQDVVEQPDALRRVLGYLPQDFGVYPNLNAFEFLEYLGAVKGLSGKAARRRIEYLLELVNLADVGRRPLGGYSGGMKQRIGIAQALLNDPQLLIVDEPTAGLDPGERVRFRNLLSDLSGERIVILSTHIVSDVEAVAGRIALISKGTMITCDLPEHLLRDVAGRVWEWTIASDGLTEARQRYQVSSIIRRSEGIRLHAVADHAPTPGARLVTPSLEDAYLYHISRDRRRLGVE